MTKTECALTFWFHISRPIPEKKWFMEPLVIIPLGGILPFGSIFIEM
jgi:transmembrane 9 superfamily protein 3